jgi:hypothetical protein
MDGMQVEIVGFWFFDKDHKNWNLFYITSDSFLRN